MQLYEILSDRRRAVGMSIDELVQISGVPKGTVSKILAGITKDPGIETLKSIVYALGLKLEDLDDDSSELTAEEKDLLNQFRQLDHYGKQAVRAVMDVETERIMAVNMDDLAQSKRDERDMRLAIGEVPEESGATDHGP